MKRIGFTLLALVLFFGVLIPAAGAAELTTEQKFEVLKDEGIFTGFEDGTSRLYESMTREQFAAVLFRLLQMSKTSGSPSYNDVLKSRWSFDEVEAVTDYGLMKGVAKRIFAPATKVTVEQLAVILVRAKGSGDGATRVYGNVSDWARESVGIALKNKWLPEQNDYTDYATRGLLVNAVYAIYADTQMDALKVRSVVPIENNILFVTLSTKASSADKDRFALHDVYGNRVDIKSTFLSSDGLTVTVVTDLQIGNRTYYLYVDGIANPYTSLSGDTTRPTVDSFVTLPPRTIVITFSEQVDSRSAASSANYVLNNGLKVTDLQLSSDKRTVTLTTSQQDDDRSYRLTISGVKDLAGNVMNKRDFTFIGNNDVKKPTVTSVKVNADASVTVVFSEKVNRDQAVLTGRYTIDKGLSVTKAVLADDSRTVTLTTSPQKDATVYSLNIAGISDLAGNVMDTSRNWQFGGVANPVIPVQLESITAINENTLSISFTRAITDSDVTNLKATILTDNGAAVSTAGWSAFELRKPGTDKAVTVQFRNSDSNPALFKPGHVYVAAVTGVSTLITANQANQETFAGTDLENRIPYVKEAVPLSSTTVKVLFSEPVRNISKAAFVIRQNDGTVIGIESDGLNDTGKIVTEVVLKLSDSLKSDKKYEMTFQAGITDAAGWNGMQTKSGSNAYKVYFSGIQ
ncbi:Ig-like domain-containing protein [Paenibacillus silvisoli]|uniref:Ig-like domain-containing protein n=1 Tax=Paenibacillus silvisoli TaxID=3110539 RepID=UPI002804F009|nr:Ig-like domain-containing protein [Paenibacillus silvisoli]